MTHNRVIRRIFCLIDRFSLMSCQFLKFLAEYKLLLSLELLFDVILLISQGLMKADVDGEGSDADTCKEHEYLPKDH